MYKEWVIDATMGHPFCFCPIKGDINGEFSVVIGLNLITNCPPGLVVAVVHEDGQGAVDKFYNEHKEAIDEILQESREKNAENAK